MVGIVAVTRFCEASGAAFSSYVDYIDRDNAARAENSNKYDLFNEYIEYMGNEEKAASDEKQSNLFSRNSDDLTIKEKRELKDTFETAQKNGSNMWQTVISFDNEYLKKCGILSDDGLLDEKKMIISSRKAIEKMLEAEKLENAVWSAAIHYNTDNIHIHIATVEPIPMRAKKNYREWERTIDGKIKTRLNAQGKEEKIPLLDENGNQVTKEKYIGTFKNSSIAALKSIMRSELENDKETTIKINTLLRGIVNDKREKAFLDEPEFADKFNLLYDELKGSNVERRYWNYNQKNLSHLKPFIDDLSGFFIERYHSEDYEELVSLLQNKQDLYTLSYGGSNNYLSRKLYDERDGLFTRLGNAILKEAQSYDRLLIAQRKVVFEATEKLKGGADKQAEAFEELKAASDRGNTFAQNKLGLMYLKGEYVKQDTAEAEIYFKMSARNGNTFADKMLLKIGNNITHYTDPLKSRARRDLERAANILRRTLEREYTSWKNMQSYEQMQYEIAHRNDYDVEI